MTRFRMPVAGLLFLIFTAAILFACGDDDTDGSPVDGGADVDSSSPTPDTFVPPTDTGAGIDTQQPPVDAGTDTGTVDACGAIQITSIVPVQGYNGVDIVVQVAGSGFGVCSASGDAGATACVDELTLSTGGSCGDAGTTTTSDAGDAGSDAADDGGDSGDADADAATVVDSGSPTPTCVDAGGVTIKLTTLRSDGNVITALVPAGAQLGGPYDLIDNQNGCTARLNSAYTVLPASASITVTKVTPAYGWTGEDTPVTIQGTGFVSTPTAYINVPGMVPAWQKLKNVAFTSSTSISGVVPKGLIPTPAGPKYAVAVLNPDGQGNQLADAFRVVSLPVPSITSVSPSSLTTSQLGTTDNVTITGCNFRGAPTVATVTAAGAVAAQTPGALSCTGAATCPSGTGVCTLKATIGAGLLTGPYLVRVTNTDQTTSADYATLVVTNPSAKLDTGFATSTHKLLTGRRSLVTTSARINNASRFLYAIGGEKGDNTILDTAEVAPLDPFGVIGDWFVQKNKLTAPRSGASVVQLGQYLYVIGGTTTFATTSGTGGAAPSGTPLATIDRAKILDASDIPGMDDPTTKSTGTLAAGSWYYRVAAVRDGTDPDNKGGETLPSDEVVGSLGFNGSIVLTWSAPPNATHLAKYRIYRTPTVNGKSGDEVLIAETADGMTTTFTDDGTPTVGTEKPLARGSTGTWNAATTLAHARLNAGATIAKDPNGQAYVYVVGGWGKCDGAGVDRLMNCYEYATISADGMTLGTFTAAINTLVTPRQRAGVARMSADNGPSTWTPGTAAFVVVAGGAGPAVPQDSVELANVTAGGVLGTFAKQTNPQPRDGTQLQAANGFFYQFGGATAPANYLTGNILTDVSAQTATTLTLNNWSNAVSGMTTGRGRMGATLESAFFYFVGGTSDDVNALDTIEQIIY